MKMKIGKIKMLLGKGVPQKTMKIQILTKQLNAWKEHYNLIFNQKYVWGQSSLSV